MGTKKIAFIGVSSLLLVAIVVSVAVGVSRNGAGNEQINSPESGRITTSSKAIKAVCQPTDYKETCEKSLSSAGGNETDPKELIKIGFGLAIDQLREAMKNSTTLKAAAKDSRTSQALDNCHDLMVSAVDDLNTSFTDMGAFEFSKADDYIQNIKVWLSGAATFQESCLDEFENISGDTGEKMKKLLNTSRELTSNGLAMMKYFSSIVGSLNIQSTKRRLLSGDHSHNHDGSFPTWVKGARRRLLAATPQTIPADVIVAQDGTGKYKTINEALNDVPLGNKINKTFVIYIKEGVYPEYVTVTKKMTHVMFIGDGATKTRITGNKNYMDGTQTMNTATVAILGRNFMAKDMGFENTAGAIKHQAVALRVQADGSIFYNCQMDAFQDTLYAHAHRQFYRDCTISGTIDFIFGDAAAMFQNCKMVVRKPEPKQGCMVTAQGRQDKNSVSGFVLQNCTITGEPAYWPVKDVNKAYLGRPWKMYSRTIIMQSQIDDMIQGEGWLPWDGNFALDTLWYAEYGNRGPGSVQTGRVTWPGIKKLTPQEVTDFTLERFVRDDWIKPSGVPYATAMLNV